MENTKYGRRREGRWTPIRAKAKDTRANPNSWETHLLRKSWDIGLLRALSLRIMMMMTLMYRISESGFVFRVERRQTKAIAYTVTMPLSSPSRWTMTRVRFSGEAHVCPIVHWPCRKAFIVT